MSDIRSVLRENHIDDVPTKIGLHTTTCPQCSHDRKEAHQKLKCLSVKIDAEGVCWHCTHCGWSGGISSGKKFDAIYDYVDSDGQLRWQKLRYRGAKRFTQRKPNGSGWQWTDVRKGQRSVLYRLPEVNAAIKEGRTIVLVEGEKDVNNCLAIGIAATCNPDGAAEPGQKPKWTTEHSAQLTGADVVILGDHDASGYAHQAAAARLSYGVARRMRVLKLAEHWKECPEGGDVSDWLKAGHSRADFDALVAKAADYVPESNGPGTPDDGGHHARQDDWELVSVPMSSIKAKKIIWLWKWRIACGKLTVFAGMPDTNKSTAALDLAARVTVGGPLPAGEGQAPLGNIIIFSAEDDAADTLRPRLEVAGADLDRIHYVSMVKEKKGGHKRGFDLTQDIERLETKIIEIGNVVMVIIDPVSAYLGKPGKLDSYRQTDVRGTLSPLEEMVARHQVAVVGIDHLNKKSGLKALLRVGGSIAFTAAPRSVIIFVRDEEDLERRLFLPAKNNNAPEEYKTGLAFRIVKRFAPSPVFDVMPAVEWETEPVNVTADEALEADGKKTDGRRSDTAEVCKVFLQEFLRAGPRMVKDIEAEAKKRGLNPSSKSIRTAKEGLKIISRRKGTEGWEWTLPGQQGDFADVL